jgi:hypothetical protein
LHAARRHHLFEYDANAVIERGAGNLRDLPNGSDKHDVRIEVSLARRAGFHARTRERAGNVYAEEQRCCG